MQTKEPLFASNNTPKIPAWLRAIEMDLPDDAIVALVDLKIIVVKEDKDALLWELKCTGTVTRVIIGSDKSNEVEFRTIIRGMGSTDEEDICGELLSCMDSGECKDSLLVYRRYPDGSVNILRVHAKGGEFAPAYEWLESTKDRKDDRVPLSVMVLMQKTSPQQLRNLAYRTVAFSGLSFRSRFEIIQSAVNLVVGRDDIAYAAFLLDILAFGEGMTKEDNISAIQYFLRGLAASKDVRDANIWLSALAHDVQKMNVDEYADICKQIAKGVKEHNLTPPSPDLRNHLHNYDKLRDAILEKVEPKQAPPAPGGENP